MADTNQREITDEAREFNTVLLLHPGLDDDQKKMIRSWVERFAELNERAKG